MLKYQKIMKKLSLTQGVIKCVGDLLNDKSFPTSRLNKDWVNLLHNEYAVEIIPKGGGTVCRCANRDILKNVLSRYNEAFRYDNWEELLTADQSDQAQATGNSKLSNQKVMNGFYINTYSNFPCVINDQKVPYLQIPNGVMVYVMEWSKFHIPEDVLVIIIENVNNLAFLQKQRYLFDNLLRTNEKNIIAVTYYTPNEKEDGRAKVLCDWLKSIPNRIVHFGDFDLAGINIYLTNYYPIAKGRISFLIPDDIEERIRVHGSPKRFYDQLRFIGRVNVQNDEKLQFLVKTIIRYRQGYDQQGYINSST